MASVVIGQNSSGRSSQKSVYEGQHPEKILGFEPWKWYLFRNWNAQRARSRWVCKDPQSSRFKNPDSQSCGRLEWVQILIDLQIEASKNRVAFFVSIILLMTDNRPRSSSLQSFWSWILFSRIAWAREHMIDAISIGGLLLKVPARRSRGSSGDAAAGSLFFITHKHTHHGLTKQVVVF